MADDLNNVNTPNPEAYNAGPAPKSNGKATASMVLGIVSLVCLVIGGFTGGILSLAGVVTSIVGLILGVKAKKEDPTNGKAKAGFIMSLISLILNVVVAVACILCVGALFSAAGGAAALDELSSLSY
jgi:heme O synthase-like polyprenyltransferase